MGCRKTIILILMLLLHLLAMLILGAVGCGAKSGSEDRPLPASEEPRGSDTIVFARNATQDLSTGERPYMISDVPGSTPAKIDVRVIWHPIKAPNGNSFAYLSDLGPPGPRALDLYDIDSGSKETFQVADAIEEAMGINLSELIDFSWAPDGASVYVCVAQAPDAKGKYPLTPFLFRYYLDSGSVQQISVEDPSPGVSSPESPYGLDSLGDCRVSPSGTRIIINTFWYGDLYEQSVRNTKRIIPDTAETYGSLFPFTTPIWLNDHEIVYIEGWQRNLIKLAIDTGVKTTILASTPEMSLGWAPRMSGIPLTCSPEGDRIIFPVLSDPEKYSEWEICISPLYIINADGTGLVQLTDPEKDGATWGDSWPCWASR